MVDNSQRHGIYAPDALLTRDMNFNPVGSQPRLQEGWFINILGEKVTQYMNFPTDHPKFLDKPKGMKQILTERGLYWAKLKMQCKKPDCDPDATDCCAKHILDLQPDFQEQKSLMHETIEGAGHLCIMLPKYHCELNFIEFFWGAIRDTSENTATTLTLASKKIFLMPWPRLMCLPFRSGNIRWYNGWMLTEKARAPRRPRFRWRSLAATNSLHIIIEYMSWFLKYLIRLPNMV